MLKLFTPQEARELNNAQNIRDRQRIKETQEELGRKQLQLANVEVSFNTSLAKQREVWAQEEKNHAERFFAMELEIKNLEKRKEEALIPIAEIEQKAHTIFNEAETRLSEVIQKEIEFEDVKEKLMKRLDDVSEKEQSLQSEQQTIIKTKESIKQEEEALSLNRNALSESIIAFNSYITEQNSFILKEKTALIMRERTIEARTELFNKREKKLENDIIRLNDGRKTLERALARINMNPNDVSNYPNVTLTGTPNGSNQPIQDPSIDTTLITEDVAVETPIETPVEETVSEEEEVVGTDQAPEETVSEITE
jgi:DNA uptake protein ComE-like DNA-binding protein